MKVFPSPCGDKLQLFDVMTRQGTVAFPSPYGVQLYYTTH